MVAGGGDGFLIFIAANAAGVGAYAVFAAGGGGGHLTGVGMGTVFQRFGDLKISPIQHDAVRIGFIGLTACGIAVFIIGGHNKGMYTLFEFAIP